MSWSFGLLFAAVFLLLDLVDSLGARRLVPELGNQRPDVLDGRAVDLVRAGAALVTVVPEQLDAILQTVEAGVIPPPGPLIAGRAATVLALPGTATADVVPRIVRGLRRPGTLGHLIRVSGPAKGVRPAATAFRLHARPLPQMAWVPWRRLLARRLVLEQRRCLLARRCLFLGRRN